MTLAKSKTEDISLKAVMQEPKEIKMNGFFREQHRKERKHQYAR